MAIELSFVERRVLGALVEKALTTPEQYPLTLNSAVTACNQKSCRDPASHLDEGEVLTALDSLRGKGFATLVRSEGSRTDRWKHRFTETLRLSGKEAAILAELLLRGPQTDGELRQRASRMVPIEAIEEVGTILDGLEARPEPLIARLGPPERRRGVKFAHTFYPPEERPGEESSGAAPSRASAAPGPRAPSLPPPDLAVSHAAPSPPGGASPALVSPAAGEAVPGDSGALQGLRQEIEALKARVTELEETFVRFLR